MNQWPRNAMSLYVAVAVHATAFLALGLLIPSQNPAGNQTGLRLGDESSAAVESLLARIPDSLLTEVEQPRAVREQTADLSVPSARRVTENKDRPVAQSPGLSERPVDTAQAKRPAQASDAPAFAAKADQTSNSEPVEGSEGGGGLNAYFALLRQHLANHRKPMPLAWQGAEVVVGFELRIDGSIANLRVSRSSGIDAMDQAALSLVRQALPLPRPPRQALGPLLVPITA